MKILTETSTSRPTAHSTAPEDPWVPLRQRLIRHARMVVHEPALAEDLAQGLLEIPLEETQFVATAQADVQRRPAKHLLRRPAGQSLETLVHGDEPAVLQPADRGIVGVGVESLGEALFRVPQRLLRPA